MPLYELVCIASHSSSFSPIRSLVTTTTNLITSNGGVIRTLDHWGHRNLPQKMKRGNVNDGGGSLVGDYWTIKFDANPPTVSALNERLRLDPRVLRWTTLKLGSTLQEVTNARADTSVLFTRSPPPTPEELLAQAKELAKVGAGTKYPGRPR